jgi:hypothetical protein
MLIMETPAGVVSFLNVFMTFALPYLPSVARENPRSGLWNRRWRRHGVVIFLKTSSRLSGVRPMQHLGTRVRCAVGGGGGHSPRLGLWDAMYDIVDASWSATALSLSGLAFFSPSPLSA